MQIGPWRNLLLSILTPKSSELLTPFEKNSELGIVSSDGPDKHTVWDRTEQSLSFPSTPAGVGDRQGSSTQLPGKGKTIFMISPDPTPDTSRSESTCIRAVWSVMGLR